MFASRRVSQFLIRFGLLGIGICLLQTATAVESEPEANKPIRFNRDVRAILSDKCFACHGPDAETVQAGLRLDVREEAVGEGYAAIVAGKPDQSELVRRIRSGDPDQVMPPPESHKDLSPREKDTLTRWIAEGAVYEAHWAYEPMQPLGDTADSGGGIQRAIDQVVDQRLSSAGIQPAPPADPITLIRRLSIDLTGIPPTIDEVDAFLQSDSEHRYRDLVDRLLNSPRYGERMASYWLDLVRYADTVGYHGDQTISQSPYRDYVIDAFNNNMPYDQFVREQLAGDLLPDPTTDQLVASGYNRLNQTTEEGGSQAKEYLAIYFADRVRNVSQVFMGATVGCAQCHDHKYDPYTTRDFYSLGAFFADLDERGVYSARSRPPTIRIIEPGLQQRLDEMDRQIQTLQSDLNSAMKAREPELAEWEKNLDKSDQATDEHAKQASLDKKQTKAIKTALRLDADKRDDKQNQLIRKLFHVNFPNITEKQQQLDKARSARKAAFESAPETVVSRSVKPRTIRVLPRGNWMDDSGEVVSPAIPEFLGELDTGDRRATRLDLANWLCQDDNPLTARTMVNRVWSRLFGRGICASVDDFGGQGTYPSYPDLLDQLSIRFVQSGWDIKQLIRGIVMSETYRRSSQPTAAMLQQDPYNDLFARQGRFAVDAEVVRDTALAVSGLLVESVGGASVRPYQPQGYYAQLNFPRRRYVADKDQDQYRRGVYTHWQRTFLHPMLKAFDAPSREECTAVRAKSNTPLQSLVLLNDPTFVEAARVFAERVMRESENSSDRSDVRQTVRWAYRSALSRPPNDEIEDALVDVFRKHLQAYRENPDDARQIVATGFSPVPDDLDVAQWAAWTSVCRVILNLHESITRY